MTGGEAYKQKLLTDDALDAAISAYLRIRRSRTLTRATAPADPAAGAALTTGRAGPSRRVSGQTSRQKCSIIFNDHASNA